MESWQQEWQKILSSPENSAATSFGKFSTIRIRTFKACQNITHMQKINDNELEWLTWCHHNNIPCLDTNLLTVELEILIPSRMSSQQSWKLKSLFWPYYYHPARPRKEMYVSSAQTSVRRPQSSVFSEGTGGDNMRAISPIQALSMGNMSARVCFW